jgi:hypothetical protein
MDELMGEVARRPVPKVKRRRVEPLAGITKTLRQHYEQRRRHYDVDAPEQFDRDLKRLFSEAPEHSANPSAARFVARARKQLRRLVRRWTGERQYVIDLVLEDMIDRCRHLGLRLAAPEEEVREEFLVLLTVQTMKYIHSGRHRLAL